MFGTVAALWITFCNTYLVCIHYSFWNRVHHSSNGTSGLSSKCSAPSTSSESKIILLFIIFIIFDQNSTWTVGIDRISGRFGRNILLFYIGYPASWGFVFGEKYFTFLGQISDSCRISSHAGFPVRTIWQIWYPGLEVCFEFCLVL